MAVVTLYTSDLDPEKRMFKSKKDADEHDKKLELAESVATFISQQIKSVDEELAETLGMLIAENKDRLISALKGKPQALFETAAVTTATTPAGKAAGSKIPAERDDAAGDEIAVS